MASAARCFGSTRLHGILEAPRRTEAGYRVYTADVFAVLRFVVQARRLGFTIAEMNGVLAIKRSGQRPCEHVLALMCRKVKDLDGR